MRPSLSGAFSRAWTKLCNVIIGKHIYTNVKDPHGHCQQKQNINKLHLLDQDALLHKYLDQPFISYCSEYKPSAGFLVSFATASMEVSRWVRSSAMRRFLPLVESDNSDWRIKGTCIDIKIFLRTHNWSGSSKNVIPKKTSILNNSQRPGRGMRKRWSISTCQSWRISSKMVIFQDHVSFTTSAIFARAKILAAAQYLSHTVNNICLTLQVEFVPHSPRLPAKLPVMTWVKTFRLRMRLILAVCHLNTPLLETLGVGKATSLFMFCIQKIV